MRPGDTLTLDCTALDDDGAGIAGPVGGGRNGHADADADAGAGVASVSVHVAGALPGEQVVACVTHVSSHRPIAWASLIEIIAPSAERRPPACRAFGDCGGCVVQHLAYEGQLGWKTARVREVMAAHPELAAVPVGDCVASPRALGYRNRSKLVCARADGAGRAGLVLGAFAPRTHRVVDLLGCRIAEPPLDEVAAALRAIAEQAGVSPYDERAMTGDLRYVVLRVNHRGEVQATLVTAGRAWAAGARVAELLRAARPEVVGVVQNINPSRGNAIYGAEEITLAGQPALEDVAGDVRVLLSPRSFFQANREVAALAYRAIAAAVAPHAGDRVVDAYAGVGGIALTLARGAGEVIGIEEHAGAVDDAVASAALNGLHNARFVTGDAGARLREIDRADIVVLNPPRKGCEAAVLDEVARLAPRRIAYLSCEPRTLARDLAHLSRRGHPTITLTPFDMLPHTPHIEVLAVVSRSS